MSLSVRSTQVITEQRFAAAQADQFQATREISDIETAAAQSRAAGDITADESPQNALARFAEEAEAATRSATEHQALAVSASSRRVAIESDLTAATSVFEQAREDERSATENATKMQGSCDLLSSDETIRALVGANDVDLWAARTLLETGLQDRLEELELTCATAAFDLERIERILVALRESDRLPPSQSVASVVKTLAAAGIRALAGYEYLSLSVPSRQWAEVLGSVPEACAGVVLVDDNDMERTGEVLLDLHLEGVMVVAPKSAFAVTESYERVVLSPIAAAYDPDAGPVVREELEREAGEHSSTRVDAQREIDSLRRLATAVSDFFVLVPTRDTLSSALNDAADASAHVAVLSTNMAALRAEHSTVSESEAHEREWASSETAHANQCRLAQTRLTPLAARWAALPTLHQRYEDAASAGSRLASERAQLESSTEVAEQARVRATNEIARRTLDTESYESAKAEVGEVPPCDPLPGTTLDALRQAWRRATDELHSAVTNAELAGQISGARHLVAVSAEPLNGLAPTVLSRAEQLSVSSPDAATTKTRQACVENARERAATLAADVKSAEVYLREWAARLAERPAAETAATDTDLDVIASIIVSATNEVSQLSADANAAERLRDELRARSAELFAECKMFQAALDSLLTLDTDPFRGSPFEWDGSKEPSSVANDMAKRLRAVEKRQIASASAHAQLVQHAVNLPRDPAYIELDRSITTTLAYLTAETLADYEEATRQAAVWHDRAIASQGIIERLDEHLQTCTDDVSGEVQKMLGRFERIAAVSKMPAGLGDWADQPFLRFRFDSPRDDQQALKTRVRDAIDLVIQSSKGATINGFDVLKAAIRAAVPKGFNVTLMKPSPELTPERHKVTELGSWSGGERLTAAVVLYCVIAALRADARGSRDYAPGALIIDNPIGQASYHPFIVLMLEIARLKGVQPVFTTGVKDLAAVSEFPNIVSLRNSTTTAGEGVIRQEDPEYTISHASIVRVAPAPDITRPPLFTEAPETADV
jgi:hypothetical protein